MSIPFQFRPSTSNPNNIPIVGQPFKVFECVPTAVIQCACKNDNTPIVIPGIDVFKICPLCKKTYAITGVKYDRRVNMFVSVEVSIINVNKIPGNEVKDESESEEIKGIE